MTNEQKMNKWRTTEQWPSTAFSWDRIAALLRSEVCKLFYQWLLYTVSGLGHKDSLVALHKNLLYEASEWVVIGMQGGQSLLTLQRGWFI